MLDANVWKPGAVGSESLWINTETTTTTTTLVVGTTTTTIGGILPWVQPLGAEDAYHINDKVTHVGFTWISIIGANVWEPGVYGWNKI
jgi:hypothetical protein